MKRSVRLTKQERADILTTAIEGGGIQYWACDYGKITITRDGELNITSAKFEADNESGEKLECKVTLSDIQKGVNKILETEESPYIVKSIMTNDHDAETADCIIQAAVFGKVIYG